MNSPSFFYDNLFTALLFGLALIALVLAVVYWRTHPRRKKQPEDPRILSIYKPIFDHMKLVHGIRMNDDSILRLLDVADEIRGYTNANRQLAEAKTEITTCQAERENYKGLWEQGVERAKEARKEFVEQSELNVQLRKERDRFLENFNDQFDKRAAFQSECLRLESEIRFGNETIEWLKSDLDRALGVIKEQEEIIIALHTRKPRGWNGAVAKRNPDGTFAKKEPQFVGRVQRPVKHLREVNEELAKDAVVKKTRSIGISTTVLNASIEAGAFTPNEKEQEKLESTQGGSVGLPAEQPAVRDWNVPQPFPLDYVVPKGTRIVVVQDAVGLIKPGTEGVAIESNLILYCDFDNDLKRVSMYNYELAPIDPRQHPEHPEFKPANTATA